MTYCIDYDDFFKKGENLQCEVCSKKNTCKYFIRFLIEEYGYTYESAISFSKTILLEGNQK